MREENYMKIAIPIWENRISPVFDTAARLLIVEADGGREISRTIVPIDESFLPHRATKLSELGVNILICGAVSRPLYSLIMGKDVKVIPFLSGNVEEVLQAYLSDDFAEASFSMPGCCRGRRRGQGQGRGGGRWKN
jgi:predicted Fe-Mo cluster-binding NifX family protein